MNNSGLNLYVVSIHVCLLFFLSSFYFVVSNWLIESLNQLFFSLWNVHIVKLKLLHTESRAVHCSVVSVVQMLLSNISKHPRHRCLANAKSPEHGLQIFIYRWYHAHRVVTLVADKLKRQWLCIVYFANCIRQLESPDHLQPYLVHIVTTMANHAS